MLRHILHLVGACSGGTLKHLRNLLEGLPPDFYRQRTAPTSWVSLRRILAEFTPEIVHLHGARASVVGRLATWLRLAPGRRPALAYTVHGLPGPAVPAGSLLQAGIERCLRPRPEVYLPVSRALARHIVTRWKAPPDRVQVVYHGLDESLFAAGQLRLAGLTRDSSAGDQPALPLAIGVLGRLAPEKGVDLAIRAFARLVARFPATVLKIAGDGPDRQALTGLTRDLGLESRVHFLGQVPDPAGFLVHTDILLVPSRSEGFGLAAAEAQAAAVPVVATRVGGLTETIEDGVTGILVSSGQAGHLAAALEILISYPAIRLRLGGEAHVRAKGIFTRARMLDEITSVYDRISS